MSADVESGSGERARRPLGRALGLALVLVGLLAVVAVASGARGRGEIAPAPRGVPAAFFDYLYTLGVVLIVLSFLSVLFVRPRGGRALRDPTGFFRLVVFLAIVTAFGYFAQQRALDPERVQALREALADLQQRRDGGPAGVQDPGGGTTSTFRWEVAALVAGAAAALGALQLARRRRRGRIEAPSVADELVALLEDTLDDLRAERDARRAVIAAYARMERTLAAHGLPRHPSEAPLEFLARALRTLEVPAEAALELTTLFERAKFSPHAVDAAMKEDAIAALGAVRDDLRAAA